MARNSNQHLSQPPSGRRGGAAGLIGGPMDVWYAGCRSDLLAFVRMFLGSSVVWAALRDSFLRNNRAWGAITI